MMRLTQQTTQPDRTKRRKRILATLVLVASVALIIWLFPNVLSGKDASQTYVLNANPEAGGQAIDTDSMGQANSVMFARLQQLGFSDFSLEQTGENQISVSIAPDDHLSNGGETIEHALALLCRQGQVLLSFSETGISLTNREINNAELREEGENQLQTIQLKLSPMGRNKYQENEKSARTNAETDHHLNIDPGAVVISSDGDLTPFSSSRLDQGDDPDMLILTFHAKRQDAQALALFLNGGALPYPFELE